MAARVLQVGGDHSTMHADARSELRDESNDLLIAMEIEGVARLQELASETAVYCRRWELRDYIRERILHDYLHPEPDTLYMLSDWQDTRF